MIIVAGMAPVASASDYRLDAMGGMQGIVDDEVDVLTNPGLLADVERPQAAFEFYNYASSKNGYQLVDPETGTPIVDFSSGNPVTGDTSTQITSIDNAYFAMPLALSGMKNTIAGQFDYASSPRLKYNGVLYDYPSKWVVKSPGSSLGWNCYRY